MNKTAKDFAFIQCRAWGGYCFWHYSQMPRTNTITGFFSFVLFLIFTEYFYRMIKAIFILKGKV
jgi:hypothetical protein